MAYRENSVLLNKEFIYYVKHLYEKLLNDPQNIGYWAVVKDEKLFGIFSSLTVGYEAALEKYGRKAVFLVREIKKLEPEFEATYLS